MLYLHNVLYLIIYILCVVEIRKAITDIYVVQSFLNGFVILKGVAGLEADQDKDINIKYTDP